METNLLAERYEAIVVQELKHNNLTGAADRLLDYLRTGHGEPHVDLLQCFYDFTEALPLEPLHIGSGLERHSVRPGDTKWLHLGLKSSMWNSRQRPYKLYCVR